MIQKISRKQFLLKFTEFPQSNNKTDKFTHPEVYDTYILTLPSLSAKGHAKMLGIQLTKLMLRLDVKELFFLGETRGAWLYQYNDYKPAKKALDYMANNGISERFNGAINVSLSELPEFIKHFFWLIRCNASLPYFYFCNNEFTVIGSICQYGNLHLSALNKKTDMLIKNAIRQTKFELLSGNTCYNSFEKSKAVAGRRIII
ncbi:hypothetical protein DJ568_01530 [Mucilaginibacter hurinus]|uniref:Uncharacterized protein n=1 Tax=Mucilaginibacter hurinus TaxID=2201324 RepID=A0A367GT27_9SPHI|nr:hypothetical protein [Mucilaginibacter hurinus]RCH56567.1 hypothetical protein DJ568_01530 [Mucilaginibacter hurinus]